MILHHRFDTKEDYIQFFNNCVSISNKTASEIWREEDRPKLEPFFKWSDMGGRNIPMPEEVRLSFDHYKKCNEEYAERDHEIRRIFSKFDIYALCNYFEFVITNGDAEDESGNVEDYKWELSKDFPYTFPLILVGAIEADEDRLGNFKAAVIDFVSKEEFK